MFALVATGCPFRPGQLGGGQQSTGGRQQAADNKPPAAEAAAATAAAAEQQQHSVRAPCDHGGAPSSLACVC